MEIEEKNENLEKSQDTLKRNKSICAFVTIEQ